MTHPIPSGLIVSCQAEGDSPFNAPEFIVAFARAAEIGGAVGVRVRDAVNVERVRASISLPIIALTKSAYEDGSVLITGSVEDARRLALAGADIIAVDATKRRRPGGLTGPAMVEEVVRSVGVPVVADVSSEEEGIEAAARGAAYVATTLSGYAPSGRKVRNDVPDFELIESLARALVVPVIAEGRFRTPEQAALALRLGAHAVVVGSAITRPVDIIRRFVASFPPGRQKG